MSATHELTDKRKYGKPCPKHPEYGGLRRKADCKCVQCAWADGKTRAKMKYDTDPVYRQNKIDTEVARRRSKYKNPEYKLAREKVAMTYRSVNRGAITANVYKHRLAKTQRVPLWVDFDKIREFYKQAQEQGLTVDHIYPLQGKLVSGLHVHNNLQLLPASENFSKCNKFEIEE